MSEAFEFELVFALPEGDHDKFALSDAVFEAGFEDAIVGTGTKGLLAVEIEKEGDDAEAVILHAARTLLAHLPEGTALHEVRPDLVSLAEVAKHLGIRRQALALRQMPLPVAGGLYRILDMRHQLTVLIDQSQRRARFSLEEASSWFNAGKAAPRINAKLALDELDPRTLDDREAKQRDQVA